MPTTPSYRNVTSLIERNKKRLDATLEAGIQDHVVKAPQSKLAFQTVDTSVRDSLTCNLEILLLSDCTLHVNYFKNFVRLSKVMCCHELRHLHLLCGLPKSV